MQRRSRPDRAAAPGRRAGRARAASPRGSTTPHRSSRSRCSNTRREAFVEQRGGARLRGVLLPAGRRDRRARPAGRRGDATRQPRPLPRASARPSAPVAARRRGDGLRGRALLAASRSPPSARCWLGRALRGSRACGPRASPRCPAHRARRCSATLGLEQRVLLWNVVPAHPHPPGRPLANRAPSMPERRAGGAALAALLDAAASRVAVVPVGRIAERALARSGLAATAERAASGAGRRDAVPCAGGAALASLYDDSLGRDPRRGAPAHRGSPCAATGCAASARAR